MAWNTESILIFFVAFTGISVLLQAGILFGIYISLRKTTKSVLEMTEEVKSMVTPLVYTSRQLMERVTPEVISVTGALAEWTNTIRKETAGVHISVADVVGRISKQMQRIDAMLTVVLDRIERTSSAIETTVAAPVRQVNGVLAAIRATIDTYKHFPGRTETGSHNGQGGAGM
jgi:hypothetical protein